MFINALIALAARLQATRNDEGQGMVEYALILVLVSILSIVVLSLIGVDVWNVFDSVELGLDGADDGGTAPTPRSDAPPAE